MKNKNNHIIYSPSDLASHSSCKHLTQLNKQNARGEIADPEIYANRVLLMLQEKGIEFEELPNDKPWLWKEARVKDPDGNQIILYHAGENRLNPPWRL